MAEQQGDPQPRGSGAETRQSRTATRQPPTGRWTAAELTVVATTVVLALLLTFPVFALVNHARPILFGMPLTMFWVVFWIVVEFVVLLAVYRWEYGRRGR